MIQDSEKALLDNKLAQEDFSDARWVKYDKGYHEVIIDLHKETNVKKVFLRALNYHLKGIGIPVKIYLFTSNDGIKYSLSSIQDGPTFPNDNHDAWIDGILFNNVNKETRYIKVAFNCLQPAYIDEIFVNPQKMK
jgi:hypothetical protein